MAMTLRTRFAERSIGSIVFAMLVLGSIGCSTYSDRLSSTRRDLWDGDINGAIAKIDEEIEDYPNDANVLKLDRAILELADGRPKDAEQTLREVRTEFDHLEQDSLAEEGYSMLTDDTVRAYSGESYENVLIRAMLAVSNLMHDGGDAEAYALQISSKQEEILRKLQEENEEYDPYMNTQVAFGAYVQAAVREESPTRYDDVARSRAQVVSWMPEFAYGEADLHRAQFAAHSEQGNGVLYVIAFVGRGPYKVESIEPVSSVSLLIADRILSATGDQELPPTVAPVMVPRVIAGSSKVQNIGVAVDGQKLGKTEIIADINELALEQYEAAFPEILARAVVRRIVKKTAVYAAKTAVGADENAIIDIALTLAGIAWEASESADTRCWGMLPGSIQVVRLELPAGEHTIALEPLRGDNGCGELATVKVDIQNGRNTYMLGHFPKDKLVGEVTVR